MALLLDGKTNKRIAFTSGISERTSELRLSASRKLAALAAATAWLAAVLGYHLNQVRRLALAGLLHMGHVVVFGQAAPGVRQAWSEVFLKLVLTKSLKWVIASIFLGGIAGFATSSMYSSMVMKDPLVRLAWLGLP